MDAIGYFIHINIVKYSEIVEVNGRTVNAAKQLLLKCK